MKVAVCGVTGMVGTVMCKILEERNFPVTEFLPVASDRSVGKEVFFRGKPYKVISMADAVDARPDIALFSAGGNTSLEWAPRFAAVGTYVIDNSSAWRMDPDKPLVIPEVNGESLTADDRLIANPNCSTVQLVMVLKPLQDRYGLNRIVVSTYQSVTGTGVKAVKQMEDERAGISGEKVYPYDIDLNIIPQIDVFLDNNYTKEEMKIVNETRKILNDDSISITATAVRIPVIGGHSESVNIELNSEFDIKELIYLIDSFDGVSVVDNPQMMEYPMPKTAHEKDEVFVGRIRRDESKANTLNLWIVSDNLRKGAATNAIQIAELLLRKGILKA
ncbi:MAG TPA: aspartate-semialdehyde dehydrogenase [Saprospiraceae bacterium]|nr:aspartate-semialdehyde dehydrogenase [Saprospiraceae bacterium]